jgi:hypothetical protein
LVQVYKLKIARKVTHLSFELRNGNGLKKWVSVVVDAVVSENGTDRESVRIAGQFDLPPRASSRQFSAQRT